MSFASIDFFIFVFFVAFVYFLMPSKIRWLVLLVGSYIFYILSSPKTLVLMIITTVTTWLCGIKLEGCEKESKEKIKNIKDNEPASENRKEKIQYIKDNSRKKKRKILLLTVLVNFGMLAALKYMQVYLNFFSDLLHIEWLHFDLGFLIPLGISFYTFQSVGYILDVYKGRDKADRNILKFALFVSFFPQIIQGPISRHSQLANQLYRGNRPAYNRIKFGIQLMVWGVFKKLVIADRAGIFVDAVFNNHENYQGFFIIIAGLLYTIQIYCDFSGGIDIARGTAQIFGIEMTENFSRPYFATTIADFWRRWHITLGSWCRDYIFYPLSLSRPLVKIGKKTKRVFKSFIGRIIPIMIAQFITFTVIGVWHGPNFKHIAYGWYNGIFIILAILCAPLLDAIVKRFSINQNVFSYRLFQIARTFTIVYFGRFFTRAENFTIAVDMIKSCFVFNPGVLFNGEIFALGLTLKDFGLLFLCICILFTVSVLQEKGVKVREKLAEQNIWFRWIIYFTFIFIIMLFGVYGIGYEATSFIYRGF